MQTGVYILDQALASPLYAAFFLVALIAAVTFHEFAHAWVAWKQGDHTAKQQGRVSLNPKDHLDPAGSLLFLFAGIGWGKPVPVNPYQLKDGRLGDFYVSVAGIVTNLILAAIFSIPLQLVHASGGDIGDALAGNNYWLQFCVFMRDVNILLAAFNLLPIPPLDGSKAIGILVPRSAWPAYQRYLEIGPALLIGIFLLAVAFKINLIGPVLDPIMAAFRFLVFLPTSLNL